MTNYYQNTWVGNGIDENLKLTKCLRKERQID